jgi:hypothetical protein
VTAVPSIDPAWFLRDELRTKLTTQRACIVTWSVSSCTGQTVLCRRLGME